MKISRFCALARSLNLIKYCQKLFHTYKVWHIQNILWKNQIVWTINDITKLFSKCPTMMDWFFQSDLVSPRNFLMIWYFHSMLEVCRTSYVWKNLWQILINDPARTQKPANFHLKRLKNSGVTKRMVRNFWQSLLIMLYFICLKAFIGIPINGWRREKIKSASIWFATKPGIVE